MVQQPVDNIEFVDALYMPSKGGVSEASLYSTLIDQTTRRRMLISAGAKSGDILHVPVRDVLNDPDTFRAPPCGERFRVVGGKLFNPCFNIAQEIAPPPAEEMVEAAVEPDVPDIVHPWDETVSELAEYFGRAAAKKMVADGLTSVSSVTSLGVDEAAERYGKSVGAKVGKLLDGSID